MTRLTLLIGIISNAAGDSTDNTKSHDSHVKNVESRALPAAHDIQRPISQTTVDIVFTNTEAFFTSFATLQHNLTQLLILKAG
jgi:hypothetical protein